VDKLYKIQVDVSLKDNFNAAKSFTFQILVKNYTDLGCPDYSYIQAAVVDDIVLTKTSPLYSQAFQNFTLSDPTCKAAMIYNSLILESFDPAPSCIEVDQGTSLVTVRPS
jgi:hypothetical protein